MVSESELTKSITSIIENGDVSTLTFKDIYRSLVKKHGDLSDKKTMLRTKVKELFAEYIAKQNQNSSDQEDEGHMTKNSKEDDNTESKETTMDVDKESVSNELNSKEQPDEDSPEKEDKSQKKLDKQDLDDAQIDASEKDVALQELLLESYKFSSRGGGRTRSSAKRKMTPSKPLKKKGKKQKVDSNGENEDEEEGQEEGEQKEKPAKKKRASGFTKPMVLSDALSEFLGGETELARTEVVKRLHQYIKDHNLQNPKDRRKIMFDDKLKDLFKCQSTTYFKINKLISKHVKPSDEVF